MNKTEAINKIQYSLSTEVPNIITPKGRLFEEYVEELSTLLIDSVIEPVKVNVTSACAAEGDFIKYRTETVWGIAQHKGSWLLTLETENEFALGFGTDPTNIMMHGFSSPDALGEWCA